MAGRFDVAHELFAKVRAIEADLGVGMHSAAPQDEAFVHLLAGDLAAAEAVLRGGYEHLQEMGERALLSTTAGMLARTVLEQNREAEAEALADVCEETAAPDDISACMLHRIVRAELRARQGAFADAEQLSAEAVDLAARTDWLLDRADALMTRGRVLRAAGDDDDAHRALHKAFDLYTRKGNVVAADRARQAVDAVAHWPVRR
jgi:tetratricopeptide (TPR) repeat protein